MSQLTCSLKKFFSTSIFLLAPGVASADNKVVYGEDDRKEPYEVESAATKSLADSTVVLINNTQLASINSELTGITAQTYESFFNLCPTERFYGQKSAGFCSGFLVAPDTIVTAGHCITSDFSCAETSFAFGYAMKDKNTDLSALPSSEIYKCSSIIHRKVEYAGADYAVVKTDRPVVGHQPMKIRRNGAAAVNESLTVIGYPAGIPVKIGTGKVRTPAQSGYFVASLDTY